jgi:hypothetical protein
MIRGVMKKLKAVMILKQPRQIFVATLLMTIFVGSTAVAYHFTAAHKNSATNTATSETLARDDIASSKSAKSTNKKTSKPSQVKNDSAVASNTGSDTDGAPKNVSHNCGSLIISPSRINVQAGKEVPITISTDNHSTMNSPILNSSFSQLDQLQLDALRSTWSEEYFVYSNAKAGTYTSKIFSQDDSSCYGYVTVNVTPKPTLTLKIYPDGYSPNHYLEYFHLVVTRLNGYSKPITYMYVSGSSCTLSPPPYYDSSSFSCSYSSSSQSIKGTIKLLANTTDGQFTATAPFDFTQ